MDRQRVDQQLQRIFDQARRRIVEQASPSLQSMAQVLSNENQALLKTILERKPESLKELEEATGRSSSNLSRTLKTMARYGIVKMEKVRRKIRPVVEATDFTVQFGLRAAPHRNDGAIAAGI